MDTLNKGINSVHQNVNLIASFSHIYKNSERKVELPQNRNKLMIDSGAYDLLVRGKLEDYPFSPEFYAEAIANLEIQPNYVVSMDYICSREVDNNNFELIDKTVENAEILRELFQRNDKISFLPVVQGYLIEEYLRCIKDLVKKGIVKNNDHIGIGSLVGRKNITETRLIIKSIYNFLRKNNIKAHIHCFGLNLNVIKSEVIFNIIDSIDSLAWTFPYLFGRVKVFTRERMIEVNSNKRLKEPEFYYVSLNATLKYVNLLNLKYRSSERNYSKNIYDIWSFKKNRNKMPFYKEIANRIGLNKVDFDKLKDPNKIFQLILKQNNKFPRESNLTINRIPIYSSENFYFLEPKNTKVGKFEFLYLLASAIDNSYIDVLNKKEKSKKFYIDLLKKFYTQFEENEIDFVKNSLEKLKLSDVFNKLFDTEIVYNSLENFNILVNNILKNLELKLVKFQNQEQLTQTDLIGKQVIKTHFLLI